MLNYCAHQDFNSCNLKRNVQRDHVIASLRLKRLVFTFLSSPLCLSSPQQLRPDICTLTDVQDYTCCEKCCCDPQKGRRSLEQGGTRNRRPHRLCCYLRGDYPIHNIAKELEMLDIVMSRRTHKLLIKPF